MHHTVAFNVDLGTTANTDVPAITDNVLTISNNHFLPQNDWQVIFAAAMSATLNRARIVSPTNRQITLPFIRPIILAATPGDDVGVADFREHPFRIRGLEELAIEASSDIAMGTESCTVVLGLSQRQDPVPMGNIFTMRGTSTTASVADTWTTITVTWADILPEGVYGVCGLEVIGATQVAGRLILEDERFRPGGLAVTSIGQRNHQMFRKGGLGMWGRFRSTALPQVQVLNTAAVSVHTVYMDLIRLAA